MRLILSGKDPLDQQHMFEFIISTAQCDEFTPNDIQKIRVKYLKYLLNSTIQQKFYDYEQILQTEDIKQCIECFTELCELILKSTCGILLDLKSLFNEEIIKSLNKKVISLLRNYSLLKKTENSCSKMWKMPCTKYNALNHRNNGLRIDHNLSNVFTLNGRGVTLEKQNEKMINQSSIVSINC